MSRLHNCSMILAGWDIRKELSRFQNYTVLLTGCDIRIDRAVMYALRLSNNCTVISKLIGMLGAHCACQVIAPAKIRHGYSVLNATWNSFIFWSENIVEFGQ